MASPNQPPGNKPPGPIRRFLAWVMVFVGVNPGFKPWEQQQQQDTDESRPKDKDKN